MKKLGQTARRRADVIDMAPYWSGVVESAIQKGDETGAYLAARCAARGARLEPPRKSFYRRAAERPDVYLSA